MESEGGGGDHGDDQKTFKVNFTAEGAATLKATIEEKLKEFMGDYTDDTLVEYVIVLLRNGRRKIEAAQELHVFLGDDNLSFISWLWDHLSSNLQLYVEPPPDPISKLQRGSRDEKEKDGGKTVKRSRRDWNLPEENPLDSSVEKEKTKETAKRQKIVWEERKKEEIQREVKVERERERARFPLRSVVTSVLNPVDKAGDRKPSISLRAERGRVQEDDFQPIKDPPARLAVDAPRRLLQFAVRDAVKPMQHTPSATTEPGPIMNRLRSILSAPASESLQGRDEFRGEEENVKEEKYSTSPSPHLAQRARPVIPMPGGTSRVERSSVFDRLGRARGTMGISHAEIEKYSSDSASDKQGYDMMEYSVAQEKEAEVVSKEAPAVPASHVGSKPSKILNISVNVNTWKSPGMVQETHSFSLQNNKVSKAENTELPFTVPAWYKQVPSPSRYSKVPVTVPAVVQKVLPKTPTPVASRSLEDPDCRTLFVSNVHFGATKDALSRHFNKFGAVLKVVILADVNTGQPTGSAYVEFLQKESAEAALSLNGTSFMSRILKVVQKNSQESGPTTVTGWGPARVAHITSFPARPAVRAPYLARGRAPVRGGGGRSLQWKRGGQSSDAGVAASNAAAAVRSFTYTRVPPKAAGQS